MKILLLIIIFVLAVGAGYWYFTNKKDVSSIIITPTQAITKNINTKNINFEQAFLKRENLKTNTSIGSIPLNEVLGGGPSKDGIPALTNPDFISVSAAKKIESAETEGLSVTIGSTTRFYPYNILVWHEMVNDVIEKVPVLVTFCPLCGSGVVFDPTVDGVVTEFGVSGKLWQSNMLMYDKETESLWSQAVGRAVVGEHTGKELSLISSQLMSFESFERQFPDGEVLSRKTGHIRTYNFYPYGDYDENEDLYFPVSVQDSRFPLKELMYVVPVADESAVFSRADLITAGSATVSTKSGTITVKATNDILIATDTSGNVLPGYHEMWFSWASHHQDNGVVWNK